MARTKKLKGWIQEKLKSVDNIMLVFVDVLGRIKEITLTKHEFLDMLNTGQGFDGSSVRGFARLEESDLQLDIRPDSFRLLPAELAGNQKPIGIFFCDIRTFEGRIYPGDSRQCLKRALRRLARQGYRLHVGPELEFFLFCDGQPIDADSYFDASMNTKSIALRSQITETLESMGIAVEAIHHEVAHSQYEIDFKHQEALTMADQLILIRWIIKLIANSHGLQAVFTPKPIEGINGSGMHTHLSLFSKEGTNCFFSPRHEMNLSPLARSFTAGILQHVRAFTIVTNQTVNSFRRLVPGYEAPVYISWGRHNRSSLVRVPGYREGKEAAVRIELRSPDPLCNPYLAFTVMLEAGMDGVAHDLKLPQRVEDNIFELSPAEVAKRRIETLPGSLQEAITCTQDSSFLRQALGSHIFRAFLDNKSQEWERFRLRIDPREVADTIAEY